MIHAAARIHGSADIEPDVQVGPRTNIWHRPQGRTAARIGAHRVIGLDGFIDEGVTLGDRVKVQNVALVYDGVTVEDGVFIVPNVILTNDGHPRAITVLRRSRSRRLLDVGVDPAAPRASVRDGAVSIALPGDLAYVSVGVRAATRARAR